MPTKTKHTHNRFCKPFIDWAKKSHDWSLPLQRAWYSIPNMIEYQNWKEIKYRVTETFGDGRIERSHRTFEVTSPSPFFGLVVVRGEGEAYNWKWWKHLKRYKYANKN